MDVPFECISLIHHDKIFIEILAPCLERKPYLNFALKKNIIQPPRALGCDQNQDAKLDELVKSLILRAPQAILGFMIHLAKLQELGLTPSNSLQFLTPGSS